VEIAFGEFVVDLDQRRLLRGDREIRLTSKGFALLQVLIENRPKALKKDELVARVWPGTFVGDNNLATLVTDLRTALGDPAQDPRFIRTVYGYGYAFVGETSAQSPVAQVSRIEASPWRLIHEDREIALQPGENLLGRTGPGVIVLDSPTVSRCHARLSIADDHATVEDLGSKNGTWVGQMRAVSAVRLRDGDRIRLGSLELVVRCLPTVPSTETAAIPEELHRFVRSSSRSSNLTRAHS
jgi:DNA-binding winged helix-turn-helix (wHTH) protein